MKRFETQKVYLVFMFILTVFAVLPGCGGDGVFGGGKWDKPALPIITAYSLGGVAGTINEPSKTISINVPYGTDLSALVATYSTTTGAVVTVGATQQISGTTPNNFAVPVLYTTTAADHSAGTYTVNVTVAPNSAKAITAFSFVAFPASPGAVNEAAKTITVNLPFATDVTNLTANFTTTGTGVLLGVVAQTSGTTANNFAGPLTYKVTAADGTTVTYTVIVTVAQNSAKVITDYSFVGFSGFAGTVNEATKTIAVALPVGTDERTLIANFTTTGTGVKIGAAVQTSSATLNDFTTPRTYRVTAADGSTVDYVVTVTVTPLALSSLKTITAYSFVGFPGSPGAINEAAKTIAVTLPNGTDVRTLITNFTTTGTGVKIGAAVQTSSATLNNFTTPLTYTVTAANGSTVDYAVSVTVTPSSIKTITAYSFVGFPGSPGAINEAAKTISVILPNGTDVKALTANFTTVAPSVKIGATVQTSGALPGNNFLAPVTYRVTAADGTFVDYVVSVTVTPSSIKTITAYSFVGFPGSPGAINEATKTISVILPNGTDLTTALTANFTTVAPSVKIGETVQTSGALPGNNFAAPVTYRVTAADGTFVDYVVTVTTAGNSAKAITAYSFVGFTDSVGTINEAAKTIVVSMLTGTNVTALTANYTTTGAGVKIGVAGQTSGGAPANNFNLPQTYTVTAADGSTVDYVVTVIFGQGPAPVNLGTAGNFVLLSKTSITTTGVTKITGDIGVSPIASTAMTGFDLILDPTTQFSRSTLVTGKVYAADYAVPTPTNMTTAISNMETAYTDAAGRAIPSATELYSGNLSGQTFAPGLYKWSTGISLDSASTVTLSGGANDVWIFQVSGDMTVNPGASVTLLNGAQAKNVFWQVGGGTGVTFDTTSAFQGIVLATKAIVFKNGATLKGRALAQTKITLIGNTITTP